LAIGSAHDGPNYPTGHEVLSGGLIGEFRQATDQLLEQVTRLQLRDGVRVQVDLGEALEQVLGKKSATNKKGLGFHLSPYFDWLPDVDSNHGPTD
jgi:hypothetical protein